MSMPQPDSVYLRFTFLGIPGRGIPGFNLSINEYGEPEIRAVETGGTWKPEQMRDISGRMQKIADFAEQIALELAKSSIFQFQNRTEKKKRIAELVATG